MSPGHLTDHSPMQCTYKFDEKVDDAIRENLSDIDKNGAAAESEHHQFFGEHPILLNRSYLITSRMEKSSFGLYRFVSLCRKYGYLCWILFSMLSGIRSHTLFHDIPYL